MAILVKRYSNRRLYDTGTSRYITVEELAKRLRAGEDFEVVDADTGQDITKRTLLQVILLESMDLVDVLPLSLLKTLIRIRDGAIRDLFARHLRMNVELFSAAQKQIEDNLRLVQDQMAATTQLMRSVLPFGKGDDTPDLERNDGTGTNRVHPTPTSTGQTPASGEPSARPTETSSPSSGPEAEARPPKPRRRKRRPGTRRKR